MIISVMCYNFLMNLVERGNNVLSNVLGHYTQLEVVSGKGAYLIGADGRKYLDFASGIAVTNTGHHQPKIIKAAKAQLDKIIHNCAGVTYNETNIACAEKIQSIVPIKESRIFFTQSGSESVEGALKAAKFASQKDGIIALKNGFHGRTMGALSVTSSKEHYSSGYGKLVPNTYFADHNMESIKELNNGKIAAVITELVQGEAGYIAHDKKFIQELAAYCKKEKIFLIIDEVQSGFGRTGKMFASQWYEIEPDIMCLAKGIAAGLPLGAVVMKKEISDKWETSKHGGTYTGNLVSCAAAIANIELIKQELPKMEKKIEFFKKNIDKLIKDYPNVFKKRSGLGFMIGLHCKNKETTGFIGKLALEKGLLLINCGPNGDCIRLAPPITVSTKEIKQALAIIEKICQEI